MTQKSKWLFPTNTENLKMIIAQGLISSPQGFKKYYKDLLEIADGYIPFFKDKIEHEILEYVTSETEGLVKCILELDIDSVIGTANTVCENQLEDCDLKEIDNTNADNLLLLAPLPLSCIKQVVFYSNKDKELFENDASLYSNVPVKSISLNYSKKDAKLFETQPSIPDSQFNKLKDLGCPNVNYIKYDQVYAYGGILGNLFYFTKNGQVSQEIFLQFGSGEFTDKNEDMSVIFKYFDMLGMNIEVNADKVKMYNGLIDRAINENDFKEKVIEFLEDEIWSDSTKSRTINIANRLKAFEALNDKPVSEQFKESKTHLEKMLLMLFLREDSNSLMDYSLDIFGEEDYLYFAIMFGARDKFLHIPKFLKEFEGIQNYISQKMAEYAHKMIDSKIIFKKQRMPLTIMDMLKNDRFKQFFANELKMEDCFCTSMPKTDYKVLKGKPVFEGIVMPKFEILEGIFFKSISVKKIEDYNKYLMKYNKVK